MGEEKEWWPTNKCVVCYKLLYVRFIHCSYIWRKKQICALDNVKTCYNSWPFRIHKFIFQTLKLKIW